MEGDCVRLVLRSQGRVEMRFDYLQETDKVWSADMYVSCARCMLTRWASPSGNITAVRNCVHPLKQRAAMVILDGNVPLPMHQSSCNVQE